MNDVVWGGIVGLSIYKTYQSYCANPANLLRSLVIWVSIGIALLLLVVPVQALLSILISGRTM